MCLEATIIDNVENISITIESSVELHCPREKENEELRRKVVNFCVWLFSFLKKKLIYYWWWCLCWFFIGVSRLFLVVESRGRSLVAVCGFLIAVASLVAKHRL